MAELKDYMANRIIITNNKTIDNMNLELAAANEQIANLEQDLAQIQESIYKIGYTISKTPDGIFEFIKVSEAPSGDYINPIKIIESGMDIEINKWYYIDDKDMPHQAIKAGFILPEDFYNTYWFEFIE